MIRQETLNALSHVASQLASDREFCLVYTDAGNPSSFPVGICDRIITDPPTKSLALQHLTTLRASLDAYFFSDRKPTDEVTVDVIPHGIDTMYTLPQIREVATRVINDLVPSMLDTEPPTGAKLRDQVTYSARALALPKPRPESQCLAAQLVAYELALPYVPIPSEDDEAVAAALSNLINLHMAELEWPPISSVLNLECLNHSMLVTNSQNARILARTSIVELAQTLIKNTCFMQSNFTYAGVDRQRVVLTHIAHLGLPMPSKVELNRLTRMLARYMCMAPSEQPARWLRPVSRSLTIHEVAQVVAALEEALLEADAPITRYLHKWNTGSKEVTPLAMRKVIHACCIQMNLPVGRGPDLEAIRRYLFAKSPATQGYPECSREGIASYLQVSPNLLPKVVPKAVDRLTPLLDTLLRSPDVISAVSNLNSNEENRRIVGLALLTYTAHCGEVWANTYALVNYLVEYITGMSGPDQFYLVDSALIHRFNWQDGVLVKPRLILRAKIADSVPAPGVEFQTTCGEIEMTDQLIVKSTTTVNGVDAANLTKQQLEGILGYHVANYAKLDASNPAAKELQAGISKLINHINSL